ncbi:hypothetical protein BDZ89DRAFT_1052890 [Hymenopellis radicata]|nr:hypothetical protein BDZ89DRAFT_1052890 [Hymenopellis radicata]
MALTFFIRHVLVNVRDLNESDPGLTRDPSGEYSRPEEATRDPCLTRPALTRESNESSTRDSGEYSQAIRITDDIPGQLHGDTQPCMKQGLRVEVVVEVMWWWKWWWWWWRGGSECRKEKKLTMTLFSPRIAVAPPPPSPRHLVIGVVVDASSQQQQAQHGAKAKIHHPACSQGGRTHPDGRLTVVRAAEATIVALWVAVVMSDRVLATSTRASKAVLVILI